MPTSKRLRVALVLDWFFYYAAALAGGLAEMADVTLITREHGHEFGVAEGDRSGFKREILDERVGLSVLHGRQSDPRSAIEALHLRYALARFDPDVIHHQAHCDWRLMLAASVPNTPRVVTVHDPRPHLGAEIRRNTVQAMTERRLLHTADGIIVHGRAQAEIVAGSQWARRAQEVFVIPHGALSQPAGTARIPDAPTVLFFGRAEYYKGLDVLVDAVLRVGDRLQGLRVVVAGRGPEIARARERVGRDPQFEWVERFISDDEIPDLFARCSVAVLPYRDASQSGVVPLAFANRRAVIATDVGSLAEAVEDGVTGMLVPPEDPDSLADAIVGIHRDRARLERMSDAALELTTTGALSTAAVASKHMDAYWALLRDCGGRQM